MNISSHRAIEMPAYREYREQAIPSEIRDITAPPSESCSAEDTFRALNRMRQNETEERPSWAESIQQINQKGWVGFALRWVPIAALCVTVMGGVFAYMNHKALDAQRTLNLVKSLQPVLVTAHTQIITTLQSIQKALGINSSNGTASSPKTGP